MFSRPRPRAYFYRDGRELTAHPNNGRCIESFGIPTGRVGNAVCFDSITVLTTIGRDFDRSRF